MYTSPDFNSNTSGTRLGGYLIEAGLITAAQVMVVLNDQQVGTDMLFGEVLVARGWVKLETIEFIMTRVVEPERHEHAAVTDADTRRLRRHERQEDLRGAHVRVPRQGMVLDRPDGIEAHLFGEHGLLDAIAQDALLVGR